jgi:hypothetical protein
MLRFPVAALVLLSCADLASAQITGPIPNTGQDDRYYYSMWPGIGSGRTPEQAGRDAEVEAKYRETLKTKIPDKKPSNDPWRTVRQAPAPVSSKHKVE